MTLKDLCNQNETNFTKISETTGISIAYLSKLNTGKKKNPSSDVVSKISKALNVKMEEVQETIKN